HKSDDPFASGRTGVRAQEADGRQLHRPLRPRRERPGGRRTAEHRDELAALHSITSSTRARRVDGTSRPSDLAVLRLTTSSNLVGCSTGNSAGLVPFKIRSTYKVARRS